MRGRRRIAAVIVVAGSVLMSLVPAGAQTIWGEKKTRVRRYDVGVKYCFDIEGSDCFTVTPVLYDRKKGKDVLG